MSSTRPREIGETIETGDTCRTVDGYTVPAVHSVGRTVRKENFCFVFTTKPHSPESLKAAEARVKAADNEAHEYYGETR